LTDVHEAAAFAPGHITAFFEIHDGHPDLARRGSRGAGVNLELGVLTHVRAARAPEQRIDVWLDEVPSEAAVTKQAVRNLLGKSALHVEVRSQVQLPVSQGFGMSGAGALSTALALAKALRLPKSDAVIAAHKAEVEQRTGLGDVIAQVQGGIEVRTAPGLPPWGSCGRVMGEAELVLCVLAGPLETRAVLGDAKARERIQKAGKAAMLAFQEKPTLQGLFRVGKQFSVDSGLATLDILKAIRVVELAGGMASQSMLGHSVFAYGSEPGAIEAALKGQGETFRVRIEPTGARVVPLERMAASEASKPG
jgi:pantoate kinase